LHIWVTGEVSTVWEVISDITIPLF
jgi:hypothetical protein